MAVTSRPTWNRSSAARPSSSGSPLPRETTGYFITRDYSYRSTRVAGAGGFVGDASASSPAVLLGVLLALKSGELAADAIVEGLQHGDLSEGQLGRWGPSFNEGVDRCGAWSASSRRVQLRRIRRGVSAPARHHHRPADRRPVHGTRRHGVGPMESLTSPQGRDPAVEAGTPGELDDDKTPHSSCRRGRAGSIRTTARGAGPAENPRHGELPRADRCVMYEIGHIAPGAVWTFRSVYW